MKNVANWTLVLALGIAVFNFLTRWIWVKMFEKKHTETLLTGESDFMVITQIMVCSMIFMSLIDDSFIKNPFTNFVILFGISLTAMAISKLILKAKFPVLSQKAIGLFFDIEITLREKDGKDYYKCFSQAAKLLKNSEKEKYYNKKTRLAVQEISKTLLDFAETLHISSKELAKASENNLLELRQKARLRETLFSFNDRFKKMMANGTFFESQ